VGAPWREASKAHQRGYVQVAGGVGAEGRKGILGWTSGGGQGGSKVMGRMARCRAVPREPAPAQLAPRPIWVQAPIGPVASGGPRQWKAQ
jgi:hypothetical protein